MRTTSRDEAGQLVDCRPDGGDHFLFVLGGPIDRCGVFVGNASRRLFVEAPLLRGPRPKVVERDVASDRQDPGQDRRTASVAGPRVMHFHPGDLKRVVHLVVGSKPASKARRYRSTQLGEQTVECDDVAVDIALHEHFEGVSFSQGPADLVDTESLGQEL